MRTSKIKFLVLLIILFLSSSIMILLQGCSGRIDILNLALTPKEKIPKVILYDPEDRAVGVPLNVKISVVFSRPMNRESVENNFSYSYNDRTYGANSGFFDWSSDLTGFIFSPSMDLPPNTTVNVTIINDAKSKDSINITNDLNWSFTTSDSDDLTGPTVVVQPNNGSLVGTDQPITIVFSEPMLRGTVEKSFYLRSRDGADIRDSNNGYFEWNGNTATYYPDEALRSNDQYEIHFDKDGLTPQDLAGNGLASYIISSFYTNGSEVYVSALNGNDSNYGTNRYSPFSSIGAALSYISSNTKYHTINIDYSNSYSGPLTLDSSYNGLAIKGGWNSDFTQQDGTTQITDSNDDFVVTISGASDITLEKLEIDNSTASSNSNGAIAITSSQNISLNNLIANASSGSSGSTYGISIGDSGVTVDNCTINGGASTSENCGIYITGSSDQSVIRSSGITGGSAGTIYGIKIDGCSPTIEGNQSISAGSTSNNPSYGIYVTNSASPTIRDNHLIYGGDNSGDDTYGILVENSSTPEIYRNCIRGGSESGGGHNNYGVYYNNSTDGTPGGYLMNNFIFGGDLNTQNTNVCQAIHIVQTDVDMLNNTINGVGNSGPGKKYAIYGYHTKSLIINNIIIGGNSTVKNYGIYLNDLSSSSNDPCIFNNLFDKNRCDDYLTDGVNNQGNDVDVNVNDYSNFTVNPEDNLEYTTGVTYSNEANYNYHIATDDNNLVKNHGFSSSNSNFDTYSYIYNNPAALYDIDGQPRPTDYSQIDLGADEFSP